MKTANCGPERNPSNKEYISLQKEEAHPEGGASSCMAQYGGSPPCNVAHLGPLFRLVSSLPSAGFLAPRMSSEKPPQGFPQKLAKTPSCQQPLSARRAGADSLCPDLERRSPSLSVPPPALDHHARTCYIPKKRGGAWPVLFRFSRPVLSIVVKAIPQRTGFADIEP